MGIGNQIRYLLKWRDKTQQWLSDELDIDKRTLSGKLSRDSVTADELLKIAQLLDIDLNLFKKGEFIMLKFFTMHFVHSDEFKENNDILQAVARTITEGDTDLYRHIGDFGIIYKLDDEEKIETILGYKISKYSSGLNEYLVDFENGESVRFGNIEYSRDDCLECLKENIHLYEKRIYEAENVEDEIYKVLNEICIELVNRDFKEFKKRFESGQLEWR